LWEDQEVLAEEVTDELQIVEKSLTLEGTSNSWESYPCEQAFPFMTEAEFGAYEQEPVAPTGAQAQAVPLEPANPYTPILQEDTDEWAPLDWVFTDDEPGVEDLKKLVAPLKWIPPRIVEVTDIPTLKVLLMAAPKEKLAGKCTSKTHLEVWKATCGGDRFMELGMMTYWKDKIQSPQSLVKQKVGVQRKFEPGEEAEYDKLLQE
jgi:hypothetical protein